MGANFDTVKNLIHYLILCNLDNLLSRKRITFTTEHIEYSKYTPDKAVDGNYNGIMAKRRKFNKLYKHENHHISDSCYQSNGEQNEKWLLILLDSVLVITDIRIYSRVDQCSLFHTYIF